MSTPVSWKVKAGLIAFGLAIGLGGAEIGLEILHKSKRGTEFNDLGELRRAMLSDEVMDGEDKKTTLRNLIYPHENDKIIYDLRPNLDLTFQRANVKTNSCGMRSPERTHAKPAGTYRIALLGDSFTFGWGVEQKETFAQRLEDNLNAKASKGRSYEVFNFGVPGYSTFQEVHQFIEKSEGFDIDAIVVFFVQNDFGPPFFVRNFDTSSSGGGSEITRLAMSALSPKSAEQSMANAGLDPNTSLRTIADYASERGIRFYFTINPRKSWPREYKRLSVLKQRGDIRFMDLRDSFMHMYETRKIPEDALTLSWDPHPSPLRHKMYGDLLTPYFLDTLR